MTNKWESRERTSRHIAMVISIALHLGIIFAIAHVAGKSGVDDPAKISKEQPTAVVKQKGKV